MAWYMIGNYLFVQQLHSSGRTCGAPSETDTEHVLARLQKTFVLGFSLPTAQALHDAIQVLPPPAPKSSPVLLHHH